MKPPAVRFCTMRTTSWKKSAWIAIPSTTKQQIGLKFADLVYFGQWFTPLREALSAFVTSTQQTVTGDVKLKLYKGNIIDAGVTLAVFAV